MTLSAPRWFEERLVGIMFRLRLIKMAFRRLDHIPAEVVMALGSSGYDMWLAEGVADTVDAHQEIGSRGRRARPR
jgi:hypothetical protein